jgi:rSAM/selenodomain-associated transferase 2
VAVVIPTLNEQTALAATLKAVLEQLSEGVRLFAADGGSSDGTIALAEQSGVRVVQCSKPGRGHQIAEVVRGLEEEIVLILHADMILPPGAIQLMRHWLANHPACPGGSFGHRFDSARRVYRLVEAWDSARARFGIPYGDQAQFYRRELIDRGGGFPDLPLMEDMELSRRLKALGWPVYLNRPVVVSPRRFERLGWWRTVLINLSLRAAHRFGGQSMSSRLCRWYYKHVD